ncbi:MAG: DEAD/DEAH box helicase family protein [Paenibacillaceae bacterium]
MRDILFGFQDDALVDLKSKINKAHMLMDDGDPQVISFSAPTGSGKTIVMTTLFEDIFFGATDFNSHPDAVIIWLSDMPELNEQTRLKIESKSDKIRVRQLITIDSNYDSEHFEGGKIYFINTQKLGSDKLLTQKSEARLYTIWETLTNTAKSRPEILYVVIDEAHRGMYSGSRTESTAQSIMQKFLIGSVEDGLCQMPLVIGVTATPQRFQKLLADTSSTLHKVIVKPEDVRESGLLKDRIIIRYPDTAINADMTMFKGAIDNWFRKKERWAAYYEQEDRKEKYVKPIFVVQVEDGNDNIYTKTDIQTCLTMLEEALGRKLIDGEVVHTFTDQNTINLCGVNIPRIEASHIEESEEVQVVFFKMNLSTGWDCPRAEVMMSFRSAQDYTYIAQLLGRMVRTPLARRIISDAELNDVNLFLPYYNEDTVKSVIDSLNKSEDIAPSEIGTSKELISLNRNPDFEDIFSSASFKKLFTYKIEAARKQQPLKRLSGLSRALTQDAISLDAQRSIKQTIVEKMDEEIARIKANGTFDEKANRTTGFDMNSLAFDFFENTYIEDSASNLTVTEFDIGNFFNRAGKILGDGLNMAYWVKHSSRNHVEVKVEVIVLVNDVEAMNKLNEFADNEFNRLYDANTRDIAQLKEVRRNVYDKLIFSSDKPIPILWHLQMGNSVDFSITADSKTYERHLFVEDDGRFRTKINAWESEVLSEELTHGAIAWLRNLDRKSWSLEVPYEKAGVLTPMYPDLIIIRKDTHGYIFDILEPHDPSRGDNCDKAKGLAKFAENHWALFGRIQLIRKMRGPNGVDHYYRLDMAKASTRNKVRRIADNHALDELFNTEAVIQ